ncbi:hypothetical protein [Microbulbifer variabilis]|uniref:hypothetical protein n=1 Tax=Microbulbifer variabilis TaxID=266805 RepID=UPI0003602956|nr:hypothetical protein [Microbulbifer variabilis]
MRQAMFLIKATTAWIVMVMAAIANGFFRESILNPYLGEKLSLPISGLTLSALVFAIAYKTVKYFQLDSIITCLILGSLWAFLTFLFEYGFGYYIQNMTIDEINQVFNIMSGNLFIFVIITALISPVVLAARKKGSKETPS